MKKLDNFINCLAVLANADFKMAETNDIYRTGIIGQFNLSFELAWKALQEIMRMHGIEEASTGSPREILQNGKYTSAYFCFIVVAGKSEFLGRNIYGWKNLSRWINSF